MANTNFNLRGVPVELMSILKCEAEKQQLSVNLLILKIIGHGVGYSYQAKHVKYHDLDELAGTWSLSDAEEFAKHSKFFEKIDEDIW